MRRSRTERVSPQRGRQSEVVDPAGASEELILKAAGNCPTGAIEVVDADTGELLYPR